MSDTSVTNLPPQSGALLGRELEVARSLALLAQPDVRLLTLTGPAGVGKTRLASAVAAVAGFAQGVFFVPLAPVRAAGLVPAAIAGALGLMENADQPLETVLREHLRGRNLLLFLDNFEHVGAAAPGISDLLAAAPGVKVLTTSREPLDLPGEAVLELAPLALPPGGVQSLDELRQVPAVALFEQRAQAVAPGFRLNAANAPAVAEICARLDGLPLAIELAAAQVWYSSPQSMLPHLRSRLQLLNTAGTARPLRQQTLRGALDWGYNLLDHDEQALFRRLAIFAGGCTPAAALAVAQDTPTAISDPAVATPDLAALVRKSLLRREAGRGGESRLLMLETIREYGLEQLATSGETAAIEERHARYYLALCEQAEPELTGPDQGLWLDRLEQEHDNLRAALSWALDLEESELAVRFGAALWRFWWTRGHLGEGRRWLQAALGDAADAAARPGSLWSWRPAAPLLRARALRGAGVLARNQGDHEQAALALEESLALFRQVGDSSGVANVLNSLGLLALEIDATALAQQYFEQSLALERERADDQRVAVSLNNLGGVALLQGDHGKAKALFSESLVLRRSLGDRWGIANALANLGETALYQGDFAAAGTMLAESLRLQLELGEKRGSAAALEKLAAVRSATGNVQQAALLCGAAAALREAIAAPLPAPDRALYARTTAAIRAALGQDAAEEAIARGRLLPLADVIALAS